VDNSNESERLKSRRKLKLICIDFETYFSKEYSLLSGTYKITARYLRANQFKVQGVAIKVGSDPTYWVRERDVAREFKKLDELYGWGNTAMLGHNLLFDGGILAWHYGYVPALYVDTLGMSRALIGGALKRHSLDNVGTFLGLGGKENANYLDEVKGVFSLSDLQQTKLGLYAVRDADLTKQVFDIFQQDFPKGEYAIVDWCVRCAVLPKLEIDLARAQVLVEYEERRKADIIGDLGLTALTLNSNARFAALLGPELERVGLELPMKARAKTAKTPGMTYAFAQSDLAFQELLSHDDDIIRTLVEARLQTKGTLVQSRAKNMLAVGLENDGLWPVGLNYSGASQTHRFSGNNFSGSAPQNLSRDGPLRSLIIAPKGHVVVSTDSSQIELRIAAMLTGEHKLAAALARGEDYYSYMASRIYGYEVVKGVHKSERQVGKVAVLSCGYGAGVAAYVKMVYAQTKMRIEVELARVAVAAFRAELPGYQRMWKTCDAILKFWAEERVPLDHYLEAFTQVEGLVVGLNEITLPSGLKLKYPDMRHIFDEDNGKYTYAFYSQAPVKSKVRDGWSCQTIYGAQLFENICQALAREVMTDKLKSLYHLWPCALQVHDELVFVAPLNEAELAVKRAQKEMSTPVSWWSSLPLDAETGFGLQYGGSKMSAKEISNRTEWNI
jgi:DNA polymerase family A